MLRLLPWLGLLLTTAFAGAQDLPDLPDPVGRAGMMAAVLREPDGSEVILAAGGTNFPDKPLWQGGQKRYHADILKLAAGGGAWRWSKVGELPEALVGAAFCASPARDALIIAGGAVADGHRGAVWSVTTDGRVRRFGPDLPEARAYAGFAVRDGQLHVAGGIARPDATAAVATMASLDLRHPDRPWVVSAPDAGFARIIPLVAGTEAGLLFGGGCSLTEKEGQPFRTYHRDLRVGETRGALAGPLAGAAGPGVVTRTHVLFVGGDDGAQYGRPPETHRGLARRILAIDLRTLATKDLGAWPGPVAVAPLLRLGDDLVTVSGEMRPGVRTPKLTRWTIPAEFR